jgi:hypothetical protein
MSAYEIDCFDVGIIWTGIFETFFVEYYPAILNF